jgi:hypothetical protein
MGGLFTGVFPESETNFTAPSLNNMELNIKTFETTASRFGYQVGLKMRYQVYPKIMLSAGLDYTQAAIAFKDIRAIETNNNIPLTVNSYTQNFQLVRISLGVGLAIN